MSKTDWFELMQDPEFMPEVAKLVEKLKPSISEIVKLIQAFGPDAKSLVQGVAFGIVDIKIAMIKKYEEAGFTRDQAIILTQDSFASFKQGLKKS